MEIREDQRGEPQFNPLRNRQPMQKRRNVSKAAGQENDTSSTVKNSLQTSKLVGRRPTQDGDAIV